MLLAKDIGDYCVGRFSKIDKTADYKIKGKHKIELTFDFCDKNHTIEIENVVDYDDLKALLTKEMMDVYWSKFYGAK